MRYFTYCRKSMEAEDRQVLSILSQRTELSRKYCDESDIEVVEILEESRSAHSPGRPVFDEMIRRIEKGEAQGILSWHPDRLARNSLDGGKIIYLLDTGVLQDLKFPTYTFENTPQGKFMLSIMFGNSKYYSDNLSQNVRRGIKTKVEQGWPPGIVGCGYLNDKDKQIVIADPERFPLVQEIWRLMLTGAYTPQQLWRIARDKLGLRTLPRKKIGGKPLTLSAIYKILTNPFYAGYISYKGQLYPGNHPPMVTYAEFDRVQELLGRPGRPRRKKYDFPFTGMIRCGECGFSVTAEHKRNRHGSLYTYYHCSKRRPDYRCRQPVVSAESLEAQIIRFLDSVTIPEKFHSFLVSGIDRERDSRERAHEAARRSISQTIKSIHAQLDNLTSLRLRDLLTDDEFTKTRNELLGERLKLMQTQEEHKDGTTWFEPAELLANISATLVSRFVEGDSTTKRLIVEIVGSNLILTDRKLCIEARKPFRHWPGDPNSSSLRAFLKDVRTRVEADDPEMLSIIAGIRRLVSIL